jgi:hypothetical protein
MLGRQGEATLSSSTKTFCTPERSESRSCESFFSILGEEKMSYRPSKHAQTISIPLLALEPQTTTQQQENDFPSPHS